MKSSKNNAAKSHVPSAEVPEDRINALADLYKVLGIKDKINTKKATVDEVTAEIRDLVKELEPADPIQDATRQTLVAMGLMKGKPAKAAKAAKPADEDEEGPEVEEEPAPKPGKVKKAAPVPTGEEGKKVGVGKGRTERVRAPEGFKTMIDYLRDQIKRKTPQATIQKKFREMYKAQGEKFADQRLAIYTRIVKG